MTIRKVLSISMLLAAATGCGALKPTVPYVIGRTHLPVDEIHVDQSMLATDDAEARPVMRSPSSSDVNAPPPSLVVASAGHRYSPPSVMRSTLVDDGNGGTDEEDVDVDEDSAYDEDAEDVQDGEWDGDTEEPVYDPGEEWDSQAEPDLEIYDSEEWEE